MSLFAKGRALPGTVYPGCTYDLGTAAKRLDGCVAVDNCRSYPDLEMAKAHCDRHLACMGVVERGEGKYEIRTGKNLVSSTADTAYQKLKCFDCPNAQKMHEGGYSICRQP